MGTRFNPNANENNKPLLTGNEPQEISDCIGCGGKIWRLGNYYQCPDCGGRSSEFGGFFPAITPDGNQAPPSENFVNAVNKIRHKKSDFSSSPIPNNATMQW